MRETQKQVVPHSDYIGAGSKPFLYGFHFFFFFLSGLVNETPHFTLFVVVLQNFTLLESEIFTPSKCVPYEPRSSYCEPLESP